MANRPHGLTPIQTMRVANDMASKRRLRRNQCGKPEMDWTPCSECLERISKIAPTK